ncbi:MAG TPA: DUF6515 family protein [Steroidobacteraceae bacterium]|nr:DUF6515 family protein [Steroidobacteraceae bacterium]
MRLLAVGVLGIACLGATCAMAQTGQWGQAEDQIPPYRTHVDRRQGHHHVYPDRGAVIRELPQGAIGVNYAGISYRFVAGVWYERLGPAYIVVAPPIGLIVPNLPAFATSFDSAGKAYLYANDVFYRPRPDLGGYEVVNDPQDAEPERALAPARVPSSRLASAASSAPAATVRPAIQTNETGAEAAAQPATQIEKAAVLPAVATAAQPATQIERTAVLPAAAAAAQPVTQIEKTAAPRAPAVAAPASDSPAPANPIAVAIDPRHGQSADQQAMDRYECYRFAVAQTGFDPLAARSRAASEDVARSDAEYSRAQTVCLESRGYSVP